MVAVYYSCKPARIEDIFTVGEPLLYKDNSDDNEKVTGLWVEAILGYKPCKDNGGQVFATIVPTFIPRKFEIDQFACGYPLVIKKWSEAEAIRCKRVFDKYVKEHCGGDAAKVVFCCEKEFNECKEMKPVVQEAIEERQRLWQNYKEGDPVIGRAAISGQKVNGGRNEVNKVDEDEERERDAVEADPGFEPGSERRKKIKVTPNRNNNLAAKPGRDGKRHRAFIDSDSDSDEKEVKTSVAPVVTSSGRVVKKRKMTDTEELVVLDSDSDMEMDVPKKKKKKRPSAIVGVKSSGGPSKGMASSPATKVADVAEMDKNKKKLVAPTVVANPTGRQGRSIKSIDKATKVADVAEMDKNKKKLLAPTVVANPTGRQGRSRKSIDKGAETPDSTADKESNEMEMENKKKAVVVTTLSGRVSRPPVTLDYEKNVKKTPKLPRTVKAKPVSLKKHIPIPYVMTPDEAELHAYKKKLKEMKEEREKERIKAELRIDAEKKKLRDEKMRMSLTNEELRRRLAQAAAGGPCNTEPVRLVKVALDLDKTIIIHDTVDVHEYILDDEEADGGESEGEERGEDDEVDESEERGEDDESEERGEDDESEEGGEDDESEERGEDDESEERGDDDESEERGDDDESEERGDDDERDGEEEKDMDPMWQQMQNPVEQDYEEIEEGAETIAWDNDDEDDVFAQEQHQNAVDDMTGEVEEIQINKFDDELFEMPISLLPPPPVRIRIGSDVLENVRDWMRQKSASVERETVGHEDAETTEYEYSELVEVNEEGGETIVID